MNYNYVVESVNYLDNNTEYLKSMVDDLGYDTCRRIQEYDARKCEKDCKKLGKSKFAKDCETNGGLFKCCIR